jgi:hypothetical protein
MKLEKFNHYGKFLYFDPDIGTCLEQSSSSAQDKLVGIGVILNNSCVAMVVKDGRAFLNLGNVQFDLQDPLLKLSYEHQENGTTIFSATNSVSTARIIYDSWWKSGDPGVAALGTSDDESEDICAYIKFMTSTESRCHHIISKYS